MEELRSMTPHGAGNGKGKLLRNSNVTVIQMMPSARVNRRTDKEIRRAEASDLEIVTVTPLTKEEQANSSLLKLHILNVRTGKIQDAIIKTDDERDFLKPKPFHVKSSVAMIKSRNVNGKKEIIRIQPHLNLPETTFNEIKLSKKFAIKPYKLKNKFTSSKCQCEDTSRMWNCKKIQISIARCRSDQFLCCSGYKK